MSQFVWANRALGNTAITPYLKSAFYLLTRELFRQNPIAGGEKRKADFREGLKEPLYFFGGAIICKLGTRVQQNLF